MKKHFVPLMILASLGSSACAGELSHYSVSWMGNSFRGEPGWVPQDIGDIFVTPNGTVYTNVEWEEGRNNVVELKNGAFIDGVCPFAGDDGTNTPRRVGETITANSRYLFYASSADEGDAPGTGITRRNRSDLDSGHLNVDLNVKVLGIAADDLFVYAACTDNRVRQYNTDLAFIQEWPFSRPGEMCLDAQGHLWILQGEDTILRYSVDGAKQPQSIQLSQGVVATDVAFTHEGRLLVTDAGPNNQILIYSDLDSTPRLQGTFGETGGVYAGEHPGRIGSMRFLNPIGVGSDAQGNLFVANGVFGNKHENGTTLIQSYTPNGELNWRVHCLTWIDAADVDPISSEDVYTKNMHFKMEWTQPAGEEATPYAYTFHNDRFPDDRRISGDHLGGPIVRRFGGQRFHYNNSMGGEVYITRFEGHIGIPCGHIRSDGIWIDSNRDGQVEPSEKTAQSLGECRGWWVDDEGSVWALNLGDGTVYCFPMETVKDGVPIYPVDRRRTFDKPAGTTLETFRRLVYLPEQDSMIIGGGNTQHPAQHWKPMGPVLERWDKWSASPTPAWSKVLPYQVKGGDPHVSHEPFGMDVVDDYIFVVYVADVPDFNYPRGTVGVYRLSDGTEVGTMHTPRKFAKAHLGIMDVIWAVNAFRIETGEYVVSIEEDGRSKITLFRWNPTADE